MTLKIGVIGIGGVGGYFGGKLCRLSESRQAEVYFLARGPHLTAIRKHGLVLTTDEGVFVCSPTLATDTIDELPPLDILLLCTKSYDLRHALHTARARVSPHTLLLPLLNGVDIYRRVRSVINDTVLFPACVYIGTHIESDGKVIQKGGACRILMGPDPQSPSVVPSILFDVFNQSQITYQWADDIDREIWTKYLFIAAFGLVTAAFDATLGQVMASPQLSGYVIAIMKEIEALSKQAHVALPSTIVADSYQKGSQFAYETKTSFQRDVERADKPDERDLFAATILGLGERWGIGTPATQEISERLNQRKALPTGRAVTTPD